MLQKLIKEINQHKNPPKIAILQRFFKTGSGQYAQGDIFLGLTVPQQRSIAKKYTQLKLTDIQKLLTNKIHEYRLIALLILVQKYQQGSPAEQKKIYSFYLKNTQHINNWDLVDLTADKIVGHYLLDKNRKILSTLAKSNHLWQRRISIIATFAFIKHNQFQDTLKISQLLLKDTHDLIHKAVGWMLRELGKRNQQLLEQFLTKNIKKLPRTTLRYAIERFPAKKRKDYLKK